MTQLSQTEIDLLKTRPHNTKLWLSIYQPNTVLSCQVNNADAAKGDRVITYDNASGDYTKIQEGMTMYVGTTAGRSDKGKLRTRSASTGTITVAENSDIQWADNDYLTVVDFYEITAVYPRIIQQPGHSTRTSWYKDYDIEYTNQNSVLGSFVCMGGHFAGFIEPTDNKCWVYYDSTGTYSLVGGTLSYFWDFQSGTPNNLLSGTTSAAPGWVSYGLPGHYTTRLIVSGSVGGVDTSYRHVSIYYRPENGSYYNPILNWELVDLSGDRDSGGYIATIRIFQNVPELTIRDGALVVIFADDWYNNQDISIGGNQETREEIVFSGYIVNGSIRYNYQYSAVEFEVGSPTIIMQQSECFSVSITDSIGDPVTTYNAHKKIYPSPWVLVEDLGVARGIYHYLRWHSTVMKCADIHFLASDRAIYAQDFDRTSLYDAVNTLISGALLGKCVSDRQGSIWFEREIYVDLDYYSTGTNFYITKQDWMDEPIIEERETDDISYIEIGGVAYTQSLETSVPYLAAIPGTAPGYRGGVERIQGLALLDQAELNTLGGYLYTYKNSRYPNTQLKLSGNYRNADIAPQEVWHMIIYTADTARQISVDINTTIRSVSFTYDASKEALLTNISLAELSTELIGDTLIIPIVPPPPIIIEDEIKPPPPPPPPPTGTVGTETGTTQYYEMAYVAGIDNNGLGGIYFTTTFDPTHDATQPTWSNLAYDDNIVRFCVDKSDPDYAYYQTTDNDGEICDKNGVVLLNAVTARTLIPNPSSLHSIRGVCVDESGNVYCTISRLGDSFVLKSTNHGVTWLKQGNAYFGDIHRGGIAVFSTYIWVGTGDNNNGGVVMSANSGATWVFSPGWGVAGAPELIADPTTPSICWAGGSPDGVIKFIYGGGSVTVQKKLPGGINVAADGTDSLWIDPDSSAHQRACSMGTLRETFNEWATIDSGRVVDGFPAHTQIAQTLSASDYDWLAYIRQDVNYTYVYGSETFDGIIGQRGGNDYNSSPYADSIPEIIKSGIYFAFWAGKKL